MRQALRHRLLLAAASLALACDGPELTVFELPAGVAGGAGTPASSGAAGSGAADSGGSGGNGAGGDPEQATAGSSEAGSLAGGSAGATSAGSAGTNGNEGGASGGSGGSGGGGSGGSGGSGPTPCGIDLDCMPGWLCEKKGCDATMGVCIPWPVFCPPYPAPVCGCDGVTYWNDCIRLQSHARLASFDQCRDTARPCEVGADCGVPYASCSHLLPLGEMCGHGEGACWVLPPKCDSNADSKMWRECRPPDGVPLGCLGTCDAIASEHTYAELHRGESCN